MGSNLGIIGYCSWTEKAFIRHCWMYRPILAYDRRVCCLFIFFFFFFFFFCLFVCCCCCCFFMFFFFLCFFFFFFFFLVMWQFYSSFLALEETGQATMLKSFLSIFWKVIYHKKRDFAPIWYCYDQIHQKETALFVNMRLFLKGLL